MAISSCSGHFSSSLTPKDRTVGRRNILAVAATIGVLFLFGSGFAIAREPVKWLAMDAAGRLAYGTDELGNRVPDFSTAGYRGGGVDLPHVPAVLRIDEPSGQDDTAFIQAALDKVAERSLGDDGFRGAVELGPGTFRLKGTLKLSASGVVLRGAGVARTTLQAEADPRTIIVVGGEGTWRRSGPGSRITDRYVPVGAKRVHVEDASAFKVGDKVIVQRPSTRQWIAEIGMDRIPPRSPKRGGVTHQWGPGPGLLFDRTIVGVQDGMIELDAALTNAIQSDDDASVWPYEFGGRIAKTGVEYLRATGLEFPESAEGKDADYSHSNFITFDAVEDGWLRSVVMEGFSKAIAFDGEALRVTATDFEWKSSRALKRRGALPLAVSIRGQNILIEKCAMSAPSYIAWATQKRVPGPNVVRSCSANGERVSAQMHQRWATGLLFDNVRVQGGLHIGNRGNSGSGQGWAGANSVVWNSSATVWQVESPPTAHNWAFGVLGRMGKPSKWPGEIVSPGKPVEPSSLYEAQLLERQRDQPVGTPR